MTTLSAKPVEGGHSLVAQNEDSVSGSAIRTVHAVLRKRLAGKRIRIYEAGGGSTSYLPPELTRNAEITVVDIDEDQLRKNTYADKKILGDIQAKEFQSDSFDLVVCYNVIEHLDHPDNALRRFLAALAPGGLVFIGAPNPHSFSGLVTRWTPHWFHVWFYRRVLGRENAGKFGNPPFPTVYHPLVSPRRLMTFSQALGYKVVYFEEYQSSHLDALQARRPWLGRVLSLAVYVFEMVTRKNLRNGDFHLLLERPSLLSHAIQPCA